MARIALIAGMAIAGAAISVATGGLGAFAIGAWATDIIAGASVGASVGSVLSNIIFPPKNLSAPPMNDLQAMSSAYGAPIPWGYGSYRIAGQITWAQTIQVHKTQQSVGGGKGGGPTTTVYTYTVSAAIDFGYGPGEIVRLWADSKLIYDKSAKGPISIDTGLSHSNGSAITMPFSPTFYNGTADQLPDPTIQSILGVHATSGFRDHIYMVLSDFPLADYGNRLPNFRAEITAGTAAQFITDIYPGSFLSQPSTGSPGGPQWPAVDVINRVAWIFSAAGDVVQRIDLDVNSGDDAVPYSFSTAYKAGDQVVDPNGNIQLAQKNFTSKNGPTMPDWATGFGVKTDDGGTSQAWAEMGPGPLVIPITKEGQLIPKGPCAGGSPSNAGLVSGVDTAGNLWLQVGQPALNRTAMCRFNPNTLVNDVQLDNGQGFLTDPAPGPHHWEAFTRVKSADTGKNYLYCCGGELKYLGVIDADKGSFVFKQPWAPSGYAGDVEGGVPPCVDPATGRCYLALDNSGPAIAVVDVRSGAPQTQIFPISRSSWGGTGDSIQGLFWNIADKTLILLGSGGGVAKLNSETLTIVTELASGTLTANLGKLTAKGYDCVVPGDGVIRLMGGIISTVFQVTYLRALDLFIEQNISLSEWLPAISGHSLTTINFDSYTNSALVTATASPYAPNSMRIYFDRKQVAGMAVSDIISDLWLRCGANPADLDVSVLDGVICTGYPVTQNTSAKGLLGPLCTAFFFDMIETDNVLKAVLRGQNVTTIIPETDLGIESDKLEVEPDIVQENDLPLLVTVDYYDKDLDYQQGEQSARRNKRVKSTRNRTAINLPMTMNADAAAAIAMRCLMTAWSERNQWSFKLWRLIYLTIDPTDVVQFTYNGGQYQARVGRTSVGQNRLIEVTAVSEDARQYVKTLPSAPALGFIKPTIQLAGQAVTFIFDIPLLVDTDSAATGGTGYYADMASRVKSGNFPGGTLYNSIDNNTFNEVDVDTNPMVFGQVPDATPAPTRLYVWDYDTRITVFLSTNSVLTSSSKLNVLNGANQFLLGSEENGWELSAFCNATLNDDGSYTLDTFLRGLRGTESWVGTHQLNEYFVMVGTELRETVQTTAIGQQQYFRGVTFGQSPTGVASTPVILEGNDLKPYSVAQLKGTRH